MLSSLRSVFAQYQKLEHRGRVEPVGAMTRLKVQSCRNVFAIVQQGDGDRDKCLLWSWNLSSVLLDCKLSLPTCCFSSWLCQAWCSRDDGLRRCVNLKCMRLQWWPQAWTRVSCGCKRLVESENNNWTGSPWACCVQIHKDALRAQSWLGPSFRSLPVLTVLLTYCYVRIRTERI